jgi:hypothetical protein
MDLSQKALRIDIESNRAAGLGGFGEPAALIGGPEIS